MSFKDNSMYTNNTKNSFLSNELMVSEQNKLTSIINNINKGFKIMIIMRGPPGSGKSYIARDIINRTIKDNEKNYVFSTDDYFYNNFKEYIYQSDKIEEAHNFNQKRVQEKANEGWSPIIVDNTNIKIWELMPYIDIAVKNGYLLEILQPNIKWYNSPAFLASKNEHGVPEYKIQKMLQNFEKITIKDAIKASREQYTCSLPQMRKFPPISFAEDQDEKASAARNDNETFEQSPFLMECEKNLLNPLDNMKPKPPRAKPTLSNNTPGTSLDFNLEWKSHEEESNNFWNSINKNIPLKDPSEHHFPKQQCESIEKTAEENIKTILRPDAKEFQPRQDKISTTIEILEKHTPGCHNESKSFQLLYQIYPNKSIDNLWDLFEKCNGDIGWAIDILLKDNNLYENETKSCNLSTFKCNCSDDLNDITITNEEDSNTKSNNIEILPRKREKILSSELLQAKKAIEKQFILGDDQYSDHVRKIRNMRYGIVENSSFKEPNDILEDFHTIDIEETKQQEDDISDNENDEMIEINLGKELIDQLENSFGGETTQKYQIENNFKTNVFMPKAVAQQLYALWMESLYNQIEEQKLERMKEDEELAKILENNQKLPNNLTQSNSSYKDIIDMELAWAIYKAESKDWKNKTPKDLATHLTIMKLYEIFPNIEKDTLLEIFTAHDNKFIDTVEILKNSLGCNIDENINIKKENLLEEVKKESEKKSKMNESRTLTLNGNRKQEPEEVKRAALKNFEHCRNSAIYHNQLKIECLQKAAEAVRKNNTSVGLYYSQIANLHSSKIDHFNHKAANCIMEVHNVTQNNPNILDLHYLHVLEAIVCLDMFLDKHISKIRSVGRRYKYVYIITGRGLHSLGGISLIKNRVRARLKDRNLKWKEDNPGLLRVKIFSTTLFTKDY